MKMLNQQLWGFTFPTTADSSVSHFHPFCVAGATAETHDPRGGDNLVFFERSLLLRNFNSVSLAEDGTYSLTLSDCYGFISTSAYALAGERPLVAVPNRDRDRPDKGNRHGGDREPMEMVRLLFLSLPASIEFDVDIRKVGLKV